MKERNRLTAFLLALALVLTTAAGAAPLQVYAEEATEGTTESTTEPTTKSTTGSTTEPATEPTTAGNTSGEGTEGKEESGNTSSACTETEGCTLAAGHEGECVLPEEPEQTAGGDANGYHETDDVSAGESGVMPMSENAVSESDGAANGTNSMARTRTKSNLRAADEQSLLYAIENASNGDVIKVTGEIEISNSLIVQNKNIVIEGEGTNAAIVLKDGADLTAVYCYWDENDFSASNENYDTFGSSMIYVATQGMANEEGQYDCSQFTGQNTAELTLRNITVNANSKSRIAYIGALGKLTLENSYIKNGLKSDNHGGGILSVGRLEMNGGEITDCVSSGRGGAVYCYTGEFRMADGLLTGNQGQASVFIDNGGVMTMTGGEITANAKGDIAVNYFGGVQLTGNAYLNLSGDAAIWGNRAGTNFQNISGNADISLAPKDATLPVISVTGQLTTNHVAYICSGINTEDTKRIEGKNYNLTDDDLSRFSMSQGIYGLYLNENAIYSGTGKTITFYDGLSVQNMVTQRVVVNKPAMLIPNPFVRDGYIFNSWNTLKDGGGTTYADKANITVSSDLTLYAQWSTLPDDGSITLTYGETKALDDVFHISGGIYSNWKSTDDKIVTIQDDVLKATGMGTAVITDGVNEITVKVESMPITYGAQAGNDGDSRPYFEYELTDGQAPDINDKLKLYPAVKTSDGKYEPKADSEPVTLKSDEVEFIYTDSNGKEVTTNTLPIAPVADDHFVEVRMKLKTENYRFCTIGTGWQADDIIILFVKPHAGNRQETEFLLDGKPLLGIGREDTFEYTGEGIVPMDEDLTRLISREGNITAFTVHFHSVGGDTNHEKHVVGAADELTAGRIREAAPTEPGVYSMVINGTSAGHYAFASWRYSIVKGNPKGSPEFTPAESGGKLSSVMLEGEFKNAVGKAVEGVLAWADEDQTIEQGKEYTWMFTPKDTAHYNTVEGKSVVCPAKEPDTNTNPDTGEPDNNGDSQGGNHGGGSGSGGSSSKPEGVSGAKTGDTVNITLYAGALLLAAAGIAGVWGYKRNLLRKRKK